MTFNTAVRPDSGRATARRNLGLGTAMCGSLALALLGLPNAAAAQEECGVSPPAGGTVTCTPAGNPYPNGLFYIAPADLTIVLQDGVEIDTSGSLNAGILAISGTDNAAISVLGGTNTSITTDADGGFGALVATTFGDLTVNLDAVTTSGTNASGILASSSEGAVSVSANSISTLGDSADGIDSSTDISSITIGGGNITTAGNGAAGIRANSDSGDIDITVDSVATSGGSTGFLNPGAIGVIATTGGIGLVTIDAGDITTTGDGGVGVRADTFTGLASVTADSVVTSGLDADGIVVNSTGGMAMVDAGLITTAGDNSDGILATGTVGADLSFDTITTAGANSAGIRVPAAALFQGIRPTPTVAIAGGKITTTGVNSDGIQVLTSTGPANLNLTGSLSTTGANSRGIFVQAPGGVSITGNPNVTTTGAASTAVDVSSTDDPVSLTLRNVSTTGAMSNGVRAVAGPASDATVTVGGAILTTGANADALFVSGGDNAIVSVGAGGSVLANGGNSITLTSTNGSTLTNAGTIAAAPGGFAVLGLGGPVTINNSGSLSSDIQLTAGADRVNNSGTFLVVANPDFGAGVDVFANSGTVAVGRGAAAVVTPTFTGLETFNNTGGLVDLRNGRSGDRLTLPGTFSASGNSQLGLDAALDGSANDRLIIGGAASGRTQVVLASTGQPVFNPGSILVQAGAASNADAFDLPTGFVDTGFVRNEIVYNPGDFSFRLTGAPTDSAYRTLTFVEGSRNVWLKSADAVSAQLRAQRDSLWANGGGEASPRFWLQLHSSEDTTRSSRNFNTFGQSRITDTGYKQNYVGAQIGLDIGGGSGERGGFAFGVTAGFLNSQMNFAGTDNITFDDFNIGLYGSYTSGNLFANGLVKYDRASTNVDLTAAGFNQDVNNDVYGARGEVGFRFGSDSFFVEPAASISYVKSKFDDFTAFGTQTSFNDDDGLRGRAGARIGGQLGMIDSTASFYVGGNYVHEFQSKDTVTFSSNGQNLTFANGQVADYGEGLFGINVGQPNGISGFLEGTYLRSFKDNSLGDLPLEGYGGRVGMRIRF